MTMPSVLYHVICAAPPALHVLTAVEIAQGQGWDVCVVATPMAGSWIDIATIEAHTGYPVRTYYKKPGQPDPLPPADAILVAPVTANTVNKWAAGISDTLALGLITEAIGKRLPIAALPFLNAAQAAHPAFERSLQTLRDAGVCILYGPEVLELHQPGQGSYRAEAFPWKQALDALPSPIR